MIGSNRSDQPRRLRQERQLREPDPLEFTGGSFLFTTSHCEKMG
jgi:hypothetical protein